MTASTTATAVESFASAREILALPWYDPLAPPTLETDLAELSDAPAVLAPAAPTHSGRKPRAPVPPSRHSSRLAAKEPPNFVPAATKASRLKALREDLSACSTDLQQQVRKRKLLNLSKLSLTTADLCKLASVAMGAAANAALNKALRITHV